MSGNSVVEEWPYIFWNLKKFRIKTDLRSPVFLVRNRAFHLELEKRTCENATRGSLKMILEAEDSIGKFSNFMMRVYIKDVHGKNHFSQKTRISRGELADRKCVWKVGLFDLFEYRQLCCNGSLIFVCMFGPESEYQTDISENKCSSNNPCSCQNNLEKLSLDFKRLLLGSSRADIDLICEGEIVKSHINVLCARSPVFAAMFGRMEFPKRIPILHLNPLTLKRFLCFLYSGNLITDHFTLDCGFRLYNAGKIYKVDTLVNECRVFILSKLEKDSACKILAFAVETKDEELKNGAVSFIIRNDVLNSSNWLLFTKTHPELAIETYFTYFNKCVEISSFLSSIEESP